MNFFKALLRPDREEAENAAHAVVAKAANLLQVGEFQFLQLAYREWFGDDLPESAMDALFKSYMLNGEVPFWARQYARQILQLDADGGLISSDPRYHRYDSEFGARAKFDARSVWLALGLLVVTVGGGLAIDEFEAGSNTSMFPPFLSDDELRR